MMVAQWCLLQWCLQGQSSCGLRLWFLFLSLHLKKRLFVETVAHNGSNPKQVNLEVSPIVFNGASCHCSFGLLPMSAFHPISLFCLLGWHLLKRQRGKSGFVRLYNFGVSPQPFSVWHKSEFRA